MKYVHVHRDFLKSGQLAYAPDEVVGAWLRLISFAGELESGILTKSVKKYRRLGEARIAGCLDWDERHWIVSAGVVRASADRLLIAGLARWDGHDLVLAGYDCWGQQSYVEHRKHAAKGGRPKKQRTSGVKNEAKDNASKEPGGRVISITEHRIK